MLETTELPSGGIYTAVGTYDHQELIAMVIRLSQITEIPLPDLLQTYGQNLFGKLMETLPQIIPKNQDCFQFIKAIDSYIHVEVEKLYPDAELPRLRCDEVGHDKLLLHYSSCRPFAKVAEGLLLGCADYFNNAFTLSVVDSEESSEEDLHITKD